MTNQTKELTRLLNFYILELFFFLGLLIFRDQLSTNCSFRCWTPFLLDPLIWDSGHRPNALGPKHICFPKRTAAYISKHFWAMMMDSASREPRLTEKLMDAKSYPGMLSKQYKTGFYASMHLKFFVFLWKFNIKVINFIIFYIKYHNFFHKILQIYIEFVCNKYIKSCNFIIQNCNKKF